MTSDCLHPVKMGYSLATDHLRFSSSLERSRGTTNRMDRQQLASGGPFVVPCSSSRSHGL